MVVKFEPSVLKGEVTAPPSKSVCHRALIAAALSKGESFINNISLSDDINATVGCLRALGAKIEITGSSALVRGIENPPESAELFCNESGSTLRFLIPVAAALCKKTVFITSGRLSKRPLSAYEDTFNIEKDGEKITVTGGFRGGKCTLPGDISSQFVTGLLLSMPLFECGGDVFLSSPLQSKPYVDITLSVMKSFGVEVENYGYGRFSVGASQKYTPKDFRVEGDESNAAFLDAFNCFGGKVGVLGLFSDTLQGDRVYKEYFKKLKNGCPTLDITDCPDLAPVLLAVAAALYGCVLKGTKRLKIKESDRGEAMKEELLKFSADVTVLDDEIIVKKSTLKVPHAMLSSHNDHRIAMALSVLCLSFGGSISGFEAVNKSYPEFLNDIKKLGAKAEIYEV